MWNVNEFLPVSVKYTLKDGAQAPSFANPGDAGADIRAIEDVTINPGETKLIKTGINAAIPSGYVGLVCSRSGLALKNSVFVLNSPGVVDSGYRGEWGVILFNAGDVPFNVMAGDRVAQMMIMQTPNVVYFEVETLDNTERGTGGFGSTGKQ